RRLPDAATLKERLLAGEVGPAEVEAVARRLAAFHHAAEGGERAAAFAGPDAVARLVRGVLALGEPLVGLAVERGVFARLEDLAESALAAQAPLIDARARRGAARECHGDLR